MTPRHLVLAGAGHSLTKKVHRLVLESFVGPCPQEMEALHRDGNKINCRLDNLHWGSRSQNCVDRVRHGVHNQARKTACPRGHALVEPNLVGATARQGWRGCKACHWGHVRGGHRKRQGVPFDFELEVAERYAKIMAGAA